ncbi:hypothetical protein [Ornithinibacillus sp. JPR2-1]|uniref:hypothetical protein n=1 Tax=Ornithinibacillus sp. JPR2-1 TaxID=2094019 RepID=UPI0031E2B40E
MKRLIFIAIVLLLLTACGSENGAKKAAEGYMDAVKVGDKFDAFKASEGFIDVFDYEFLQVVDKQEIQDTRTIDYDFWKDYETEYYDSFLDYKDYYKELYDGYEILEDNDDELILWDGKSYYDVYTLLYNVEIANGKGEKLFKKAEITVEEGIYWDGDDYKDGWIITDVYLR